MATNDEPIGLIELEGSLSDAEKPPEVPPGRYNGEVQDVQKQTSGKGNSYLAVKFVIPPSELPADIADALEDGAVLYWNRVMLGSDARARYGLRKFVEALGLGTNTTTIDPNDWMGRTARLTVVQGQYQGETRAEIRSVEPADGASGQAAKAPAKAPAPVPAATQRAARRR